MKKQTKGIFAIVFFGGALLFWATAASMPNIFPPEPGMEITETGTPADFFPDAQRAQFCGSGTAGSNTYVQEYQIPTACTMPLAIVTDPQGQVWFTETNTGQIAKFDPSTEEFTEYENTVWPTGMRSMMWGIDYSPDGSILFTDEAFDVVWKFSIEDQAYDRIGFPTEGDSLPQTLMVDGSQVIVNDFTGNKISFFNLGEIGDQADYLNLPSALEGAHTASFAIDENDNLWYTNWIFQEGGFLVKFDQRGYDSIASDDGTVPPLGQFIEIFELPQGMGTPNGIAIDGSGKIWIADTSSSFFFSYDQNNELFTPYPTSIPPVSAYGNASGLIKTPITRPYWIAVDQNERIVFNEQTGNRIGIFDPISNSLVEYLIPSKNPTWADCQIMSANMTIVIPDCGLAQVFDFTVNGDKVWFTEWVENNIGVVDTSIPLPFEVEIAEELIVLKKGEGATINVNFIPNSGNGQTISLTSSSTASFADLSVKSSVDSITFDSEEPISVPILISSSDSSLSGRYKVLIGGEADDVTISKYIDIQVES